VLVEVTGGMSPLVVPVELPPRAELHLVQLRKAHAGLMAQVDQVVALLLLLEKLEVLADHLQLELEQV
jgi:hypothetical protein